MPGGFRRLDKMISFACCMRFISAAFNPAGMMSTSFFSRYSIWKTSSSNVFAFRNKLRYLLSSGQNIRSNKADRISGDTGNVVGGAEGAVEKAFSQG